MGDAIAKKVEEILKDWGIRNVSTITVDNTSSNDVDVGILMRRSKNMCGLVGEGEFIHMCCCTHVLNLVVTDGLKNIMTLLLLLVMLLDLSGLLPNDLLSSKNA